MGSWAKGSSYLSDWHWIIGIRRYLDLHPLDQSFQLLANIAGSLHRTMLNKVFITPLSWVIYLCPFVINIQKGQVVPAGTEEIHTRVVRVHDFVFRTIEDGIVDG